MFRYNNIRKLSENERVSIVSQLLANLSKYQAAINNLKKRQFGNESFKLILQLLGLSTDDFENKTNDEIKAFFDKLRREIFYLFHPDKYTDHPDIYNQLNHLRELIEPAIEILGDHIKNNKDYHSDANDGSEVFHFKRPIILSDFQLPRSQSAFGRDGHHLSFWYDLIRFNEKVKLKKNKDIISEQYAALYPAMSIEMKAEVSNTALALCEDDEYVEVDAAEAFYEFYRQNIIEAYDSSRLGDILSYLSAEIAKKIIFSPAFPRQNNLLPLSGHLKLLRKGHIYVSSEESVIEFYLVNAPEYVTEYLLKSYGVKDSTEKAFNNEEIEGLIKSLRNKKLLNAVIGSGLSYLMLQMPELLDEYFENSECMLQLYDNEYKWKYWEQAALKALQRCGVEKAAERGILQLALHPEHVTKSAKFDSEKMIAICKKHEKRLPKWAQDRIYLIARINQEKSNAISANGIASEKALTLYGLDKQTLVEYRTEGIVLPEQAEALERYVGRGIYDREATYIEYLRPDLLAWLDAFKAQHGDVRQKSVLEKVKNYLDEQLANLVKGSVTQYDYISLFRLAKALHYDHEFTIAQDDALRKLAKEFDEYVIKDYRNPDEEKKALADIKSRYLRLDAMYDFDNQYRDWRATLRRATGIMLLGDSVSHELIADDSQARAYQSGFVESEQYMPPNSLYHAKVKLEKHGHLITDLRQVYRFSKKLGGGSEFIEITKRFIPGLAIEMDGKEVQTWEHIEVVLSKLNDRRLNLLLEGKPLALTHCLHETVHDSAAVIANSIVPSLTYTDKITNAASAEGMSSNNALVVNQLDPWAKLASLVYDAKSESELKKRHNAFQSLLEVKATNLLSRNMLKAIDVAWKCHLKMLCEQASKDKSAKSPLGNLFGVSSYAMLMKRLPYADVMSSSVTHQNFIERIIDQLPGIKSSKEFKKFDPFYKSLMATLLMDKYCQNMILKYAPIHFIFELKFDIYQNAILALRNYMSESSAKLQIESNSKSVPALLAPQPVFLSDSHLEVEAVDAKPVYEIEEPKHSKVEVPVAEMKEPEHLQVEDSVAAMKESLHSNVNKDDECLIDINKDDLLELLNRVNDLKEYSIHFNSNGANRVAHAADKLAVLTDKLNAAALTKHEFIELKNKFKPKADKYFNEFSAKRHDTFDHLFVNILIALTFVGFLIQSISKCQTGQWFFFFGQTSRQNKMRNIQEAFDKLEASSQEFKSSI